eukprot:2018031-Ditylum_brightwellii.AAC.1
MSKELKNRIKEKREFMVEAFELMMHEKDTDLTPACLGGTGDIFIKISKPDEGTLEDIMSIRPNNPVPDKVMDRDSRKRGRNGRVHHGVML